MVSVETLKAQQLEGRLPTIEYRVGAPLNLFDGPDCKALATQAWPGRQLRFALDFVLDQRTASKTAESQCAYPVRLCEDDYPAWIQVQDLASLEPATHPYPGASLNRDQILARLPYVVAFLQAAAQQPNEYLWGGTIGPHFDCSGLMQRAFAEQGIWLPRDAYQQEAFTQSLGNPASDDLSPGLTCGDLIFFGPPDKANHVAFYLGDGQYIHSSGKDQGRNGIGFDLLAAEVGDTITQTYYQQIHGAGRIMQSYQP